MNPDIKNLVGDLVASKNWPLYRSEVGKQIGKAEFAWVVRFVEILDALGDSDPSFVHSILNDVEQLLAMWAAPKSVETLVEIMKVRRIRPFPPTGLQKQGREGRTAELLAAHQKGEALIQALALYRDNPNTRELLACWVQDYLVRHKRLPPGGDFVAFWKVLEQSKHPLAWLPLDLLECERNFSSLVPSFYANGSGRSGTPVGVKTVQAVVEGCQLPTLSIQDRPAPSGLDLAVGGWNNESNGESESKSFHLDPPLPQNFPPSELLKRLDLECLSGVRHLTCNFGDLADGLNNLFAAAVSGGAYGGATGAAYGRLLTWQSVRAFVDGDQADSIYTLANQAAQFSWLIFSAESNWFFNEVCSDLGIASISPSRDIVRVLAATDTS